MSKIPKVKKIYTDVLIRLLPGPLGKGQTIAQAAKDLAISQSAVKYRLKAFKTKYPEAWEEFKRIKSKATRERYGLRWKRNYKQNEFIHTGDGFSQDNTLLGTKGQNYIEWAESNGLVIRKF